MQKKHNYPVYCIIIPICLLLLQCATIPKITDSSHYSVYAITLDDTGEYLAASIYISKQDLGIAIWNLKQGKVTQILRGHTDVVYDLTFVPGSLLLVSGSKDSTVKVWNAADGSLLYTLSGHKEDVYSVAVDPVNQRIFSGGLDKTIKIWNLTNGALVRTLEGHSDRVTILAINRQDRVLASGSNDRQIMIWDLTDYKLLDTLKGHVGCIAGLAFDETGKQLYSSGCEKIIFGWDWKNNQIVQRLKGHEGLITRIIPDPTGKRLYSIDANQFVGIWDTENGEVIDFVNVHSNQSDGLAVDKQGRFFATGSTDHTIQLRSQKDNSYLLTIYTYADAGIMKAGEKLFKGTGEFDKYIESSPQFQQEEAVLALLDIAPTVPLPAIDNANMEQLLGQINQTAGWNKFREEIIQQINDRAKGTNTTPNIKSLTTNAFFELSLIIRIIDNPDGYVIRSQIFDSTGYIVITIESDFFYGNFDKPSLSFGKFTSTADIKTPQAEGYIRLAGENYSYYAEQYLAADNITQLAEKKIRQKEDAPCTGKHFIVLDHFPVIAPLMLKTAGQIEDVICVIFSPGDYPSFFDPVPMKREDRADGSFSIYLGFKDPVRGYIADANYSREGKILETHLFYEATTLHEVN